MFPNKPRPAFFRDKKNIIILALGVVIIALVVGGIVLLSSVSSLIRGAESGGEISSESPAPDGDTGVSLSDAESFELQRNTLTKKDFTSDGDLIRCSLKGAKYGVDVSEHQGVIDWESVRAAGVDFAMLRAGYRGYTEGGLFADTTFEQNAQGATDAGIQIGAYFFSQAVTCREAEKEADFVISILKKYDITYPVAFDWEHIDSDDARTNNISNNKLTECAMAFCEKLKAAGYLPAVYFNSHFGYEKYRIGYLGGYNFWLAEYNSHPSFPYAIDIWQYSNSAAIDGITGNVDVNISFTSFGDDTIG